MLFVPTHMFSQYNFSHNHSAYIQKLVKLYMSLMSPGVLPSEHFVAMKATDLLAILNLELLV